MARGIAKWLVAALSVAVLTVPGRAETWDCTITSLLPQNKGQISSVRIEIDGNQLEYEVVASHTVSAPDAPRTWVPFFEYHVLANNDVGIVAANPQASNSHALGIHLGAWVLTIVKPSGSLRIGSVKFTGDVSDDVMGTCKAI